VCACVQPHATHARTARRGRRGQCAHAKGRRVCVQCACTYPPPSSQNTTLTPLRLIVPGDTGMRNLGNTWCARACVYSVCACMSDCVRVHSHPLPRHSYMNAVLQTLSHCAPFRRRVIELGLGKGVLCMCVCAPPPRICICVFACVFCAVCVTAGCAQASQASSSAASVLMTTACSCRCVCVCVRTCACGVLRAKCVLSHR
jgi:hypothetical protein